MQFQKRIVYTAIYLTKNTWFKFVGKGMKMEYKSLEEIEKAIQETNIKEVDEYRIEKHEVQVVKVI